MSTHLTISCRFSYEPATDVCYSTLDHMDYTGYRVGDDGSIWSCRSPNGRGPLKNKWKRLQPVFVSGYKAINLYRRGKSPCSKLIHRLVLEAFVGPCPDGLEACHFPDRDRRNSSLANLRWDTNAANKEDSRIHGTRIMGEKCKGHKLTEDQVILIRKGGYSDTKFANMFGVRRAAVFRARRGVTWKHATLKERNDELPQQMQELR